MNYGLLWLGGGIRFIDNFGVGRKLCNSTQIKALYLLKIDLHGAFLHVITTSDSCLSCGSLFSGASLWWESCVMEGQSWRRIAFYEQKGKPFDPLTDSCTHKEHDQYKSILVLICIIINLFLRLRTLKMKFYHSS